MSKRYAKSEQFLERSLQSIPLASQTFSKSMIQYPLGVSPLFAQKGKGSRLFDIDGNEYIDFVNGLASLTLGYNDPDVQEAVIAQIHEGTIFSLPHPLETFVAEKIIEMVPCAEMVRFGKNESDATAGAIRLARAFTRRDRVAVCGYHGWQDWYIGSTSRDLGVPKATKELTHVFIYNDIDSLKKLFQQYPNDIAAVILEPMNVQEPKNGFLHEVKELTHQHGAILIFDETITGFRFANGGAQEYFGVIPDLATFGKGLANGYPLSAIVGKKEIMQLMEEIFFSFTFGGETLSLAASLATLNKLQREPVIDTLYVQGSKLINGLRNIIEKLQLQEVIDLSGHPSWSFVHVKPTSRYNIWEIKTLFMQELFQRGVLMIGTHNMSYAHSDEDIEITLNVYAEVLTVIKQAMENETLEQMLRTKPIEPLFKIRS
ncbi:glutamate-1-semialdehyde 2,1-aminomutase [Anoxybacillus voinovskiensis]|uniref:Glutamate-1-semialdehyde 2,1-aminomutase n=1 Tax=Anoxybacteroides voinovskiense TaxID=230470 RepID=A0A840DQ49_9BACL|nr:aminotransferase class III-fold pyridoxal phosphate-dependent enzyme [Anoxybacillus voinovskiensis]MBB4073745.1 glutamate-1-semialdehyde 2,1-aminomutase [Anoxybacillus voinovskiensis]GGJ64239.1 glutamate-1-semialdehyde 2,1-aminomutase [Anoxybacillus voinovskiensis]